MKKLFRISFLLAVFCLTVPVYADGDMSTGNKTCTQNCAGLMGGGNPNPSTLDDKTQDDLTFEAVYTWINKQISDILN